MIEKFKRERLATPTKHDKEERPTPRTPASVNRDLACLSKILSMAFDNELIDSNPMRRVRMLKESPSRERFISADEEKRLFAQLTGRQITFAPSSPLLLTRGFGAERSSGFSGNT